MPSCPCRRAFHDHRVISGRTMGRRRSTRGPCGPQPVLPRTWQARLASPPSITPGHHAQHLVVRRLTGGIASTAVLEAHGNSMSRTFPNASRYASPVVARPAAHPTLHADPWSSTENAPAVIPGEHPVGTAPDTGHAHSCASCPATMLGYDAEDEGRAAYPRPLGGGTAEAARAGQGRGREIGSVDRGEHVRAARSGSPERG